MATILGTTRKRRASATRGINRFVRTLLLAALAGCGSNLGQLSQPGDLADLSSPSPEPPGKTGPEPNDTFLQATEVIFDVSGRARVMGTIEAPGDLDVFLLGHLSRGDEVTVDADTTGSRLDVSVAIFDDRQRLVYPNDDRGGAGTRFLDSLIEWVVRHDGDPYYLVVTHSAFSGSDHAVGAYTVDLKVTAGSPVPQPVGQVLLLDFDGAEVDSPAIGSVTVDPFDAASISPIYRGRTEIIKETIRGVFEQNFERFNVTIVTTDDPPLPAGTLVSSVYFGGFNPRAFGISEAVDLYNADFCDDALIFAESFGPGVFSTPPTASEIGIAIGNVGSHEAGHLLGLNHVDDDRALMDDQSAADAFLEDQEFMEAPLSRDIMSIGTQDAVLLLNETVGPRPAAGTAPF